MTTRKLRAWREAGLIDAETAARIEAWEAAHSRPLGLWALVGLGVLTIGLGIVSLVAANWDAIPGDVRLAVHFALMVGLAAFICFSPLKLGAHDQAHDGALFLTAVLGLTFLGHLGQVYQTSSPLWQPLLAWMLIFSPLLLIFGRGWLVGGLWFAGLLGTIWAHADAYGVGRHVAGAWVEPERPVLYWGLIAAPVMIVGALSAILRTSSARPDFWRWLHHMAIVTILLGISLFIMVSRWDSPDRDLVGIVAIHSLLLLCAAGVLYAAQRTASNVATAGILAVAALLDLVQAVLLYAAGGHGPWISALIFIALWSAVAYAGLSARWRGAFQWAISIIALRVVILSFELSDDLLGSGVGLIVSGLVAVGVAWGSVRISKRYAPSRGGAA